MDKQDIKRMIDLLADMPKPDFRGVDDSAIVQAVRSMVLDMSKVLTRSGVRPELFMSGLVHALSFQTVALSFHIQRVQENDPDLESYDIDTLREDTRESFESLLQGMRSEIAHALEEGIKGVTFHEN